MATSDHVKLLEARSSPFVNRVQLALNLKLIDYEFLPELNFPIKSELLLKSNPIHKKIPVLIHGDKLLCESLVIMQYIDEAEPENGLSILSSNPYDRATEKFWTAYIDNKWHPILRSLADGKEESRVEIVEKLHQGLKLLEGVFVKSSNGKDFFGGKFGLPGHCSWVLFGVVEGIGDKLERANIGRKQDLGACKVVGKVHVS